MSSSRKVYRIEWKNSFFITTEKSLLEFLAYYWTRSPNPFGEFPTVEFQEDNFPKEKIIVSFEKNSNLGEFVEMDLGDCILNAYPSDCAFLKDQIKDGLDSLQRGGLYKLIIQQGISLPQAGIFQEEKYLFLERKAAEKLVIALKK